MQLAKTYSGQRGEMGELVPAIREMSSEQLQHGEAVKFVLEQYKGLSEAAADGILTNEEISAVVAAAPSVRQAVSDLFRAIEGKGV